MNEVALRIFTGKWSQEELDVLIHEASLIDDTGERIGFLSRQFLGVPYEEATLIGGMDTPEELVINLGGMDCFTFVDYVEAMRLSTSFSEFIENVRKVRYRSGDVSFETRNHFFTDWTASETSFVEDATEQAGGPGTVRVRKLLNVKDNGAFFVEGIPPVAREIAYIPSDVMDVRLFDGLKTGDYAGLYSDMPGLDVSHTGIIIRRDNTVYLSHASSKYRKVVDEEANEYMSGRPGLIILRPKRQDS